MVKTVESKPWRSGYSDRQNIQHAHILPEMKSEEIADQIIADHKEDLEVIFDKR